MIGLAGVVIVNLVCIAKDLNLATFELSEVEVGHRKNSSDG